MCVCVGGGGGGASNVLLKYIAIIAISSDDRLDGYQRKKYVCKLVFIFLLGNDIDFGHQEAVNLLSSARFSEKQIVSSVLATLIYHIAVVNTCNDSERGRRVIQSL